MFVTIWLLAILFILGLCIGSFINAFEYRLYNKIDFIKARSHCPKCKHALKAQDLVPLLSFVLIGGKCRYCGTKVSWQYPIIEFLSGMLFLASGCYVLKAMHIDGVLDMLFMLLISIFIGLLFALFLFFALYDVKHKIIPNEVIYLSIIFAIFFDLVLALGMHLSPIQAFLNIWGDFSLLWNMLASVLGGLFIILIIVITKGKGMGGGDVKLVAFIGLLLGWKRLLVAFYAAVITGSVIGIIWALIKRRKIRGFKVPFGLFLSIGGVFSILWGESIVEDYMRMLWVL
jgi:leader peptidase (prepilin peptidase)/N-methyltransferase